MLLRIYTWVGRLPFKPLPPYNITFKLKSPSRATQSRTAVYNERYQQLTTRATASRAIAKDASLETADHDMAFPRHALLLIPSIGAFNQVHTNLVLQG